MQGVKKPTAKKGLSAFAKKSLTNHVRMNSIMKVNKHRSAKDVLDEFAETTTLLGIQHVLRKKSFLWFFAYLICAIMSVVQSWGAATEFFSQKTSQKYSISSKRFLPFPSVTVCSNAVIANTDELLEKIPDYNQSSEDQLAKKKCESEEDQQNWEDTVDANAKHLIKYLRTLSPEERTNISVNLEEFISSCKFGGAACNLNTTGEIFKFNNPYFGNCFTFNRGLPSDQSLMVDIQKKLVVVLKFGLGYKQVTKGRRKIGVLIHAPGSAPVLDSAAFQEFYGGQYVDISLTLMEKKFIKRFEGGKPSCVYDEEKEYRERSIFYSENSEYLYSVEACMETCEQRSLKDDCQILDASSPVTKEEKKLQLENNFQLPPIDCNYKRDLDMETCNCPLSCNYVQYGVNSDTTEITLQDCEKQGIQNSSTKSVNDKKNQRVKFSVGFQTNIFESVEEEGKYTISEFLGILGGNMSLWIGLCVLSMLELVELAWNLICVRFGASKNNLTSFSHSRSIGSNDSNSSKLLTEIGSSRVNLMDRPRTKTSRIIQRSKRKHVFTVG